MHRHVVSSFCFVCQVATSGGRYDSTIAPGSRGSFDSYSVLEPLHDDDVQRLYCARKTAAIHWQIRIIGVEKSLLLNFAHDEINLIPV